MFRPAPERGAPAGADGVVNTICVGSANGHLGTAEALADALDVGRSAARECGHEASAPAAPELSEPAMAPIVAHWFTPSPGGTSPGPTHFVEYQHDVTTATLPLSARPASVTAAPLPPHPLFPPHPSP